ncbi:Bug family tripartite tricarboxylate transporter substrate binding protein [Enterovirga aerilata]|uniref:Tripartite tricarboxylate transporter substrate binding protein n=1 Tax=Enterovirga aerilata TaxID=2730920 RepID=A0A849I523_9HYPH|nr:tripartite tricarboxylate transporter substrate binding protein [Enterovirga sp. DB1703]NNM72431.1 tripartite tricarboxylate transporter substrate binding protein [Enterovirga sp. DB1703]
MRSLLTSAWIGLAVAAFAGPTAADTYPSRPIRLVMPFGPGSASDTIARIVAEKLSAQLGQRVLVENKAGAGGNIGTDAVAKSEPDGYTLVFAAPGPFVINRTLDTLPYDPERDFEFISLVAQLVNVLVVNPTKIPVANVQEFIAFVKARPGQIGYASVGRGSSQHLAGAYFDVVAGTRMVHVPYRSGSQIAVDLVSGDVPASFQLIPNVVGQLAAGQLKALAVTTKKRSRSLPDVPTMEEAGVANYESYGWFGLAVPKGTPAAIIERLQRETAAAVADPAVQARLVEIGTEPGSSTSDEFKAFVSAEIIKWRDIIGKAAIKSE